MSKQTRLLVLVTVLLTIAVPWLAGCSWRLPWQAAPTVTPGPLPPVVATTVVPPAATAQPEATATPVVALPPAQILLERALEALAGLDSWHLEVDMPLAVKFRGLSIEAPIRYTGNFRAPNRLEGDLSLQLLGLVVQKEMVFETQTMMVGNAAGGGRWVSQRPASILYMMGVVGFHPGKMQDVEVVGTETLDGVEVYHLTGTVPVEEMAFAREGMEVALEGDLQYDVWIGVDDGLPRQGIVGGELEVTGEAEVTLQVVGLATLSDFGLPAIAAEPETMLVEADGIRCGADDEMVEYADEERGISFCYPATSVMDELVDTCSTYVVSPEGVALGNEIPGNMVLIYPDEMVDTFGASASGAAEVTGRTALCTLRFLASAVMGEGRSLVELYRAAPTPTPTLAPGEEAKPLVIRYTGIQQGDVHTVSISYVVDEDEYGALVDAVTGSIVIEERTGR